jgi:hypothetical protein
MVGVPDVLNKVTPLAVEIPTAILALSINAKRNLMVFPRGSQVEHEIGLITAPRSD